MHSLYADEVAGSRRSRFEEREPEAYTPPRENGAEDAEPEGSPLLIQPNELSRTQQQKQPTYNSMPRRDNGQELSASTIEKFRDSGGPRASPVSTTSSMGGSYRDHEMRLHQSIIYNRTRIKLEQHQRMPQPVSPQHSELRERLSPSHVLTPNQSPASYGGRNQNQLPPQGSAIHPMHRQNQQQQQQYHSQSDPHAGASTNNNDDTETAFSVPFDQKQEGRVPKGSSYSHSTRPMASGDHNHMYHDPHHNDDQTLMSGYSKPFDEKTEFMNAPDTAHFGRHTPNLQDDRQSSREEPSSSTFWKHASPPPVIDHRMVADRFKMPPPRLSDPAAYQHPVEYPPNTTKPQKRQATSTLQDRMDADNPHQSSLRRSPTNTRSVNIPENSRSWEQHTEKTRPSSRLDLNLTNGASSKHVLHNEGEKKDGDDDDSLFGSLKDDSQLEPGDNKEKSTNKKKNRRSSRMYAEDFDDSSIDTPAANGSKVSASPASLSLRAQEAWKRNRHQAARSQQPAIAEEEDSNPAARNKVSFGAVDTVHHYPNPNDVAENAATENASVTSEYTKSMESEVEDIFKDIFLIGDAKDSKPGKKKVKPKNIPEPSQDESTVDSLITDADTLNTYTDDEEDGTKETGGGSKDSSTAKGTKQVSKARHTSSNGDKPRKKKSIPEDEEDPILRGVWNVMETSVGAIGGALGLLAPDDDDTISAYSSQVTERYDEAEDDEPSATSTPPKKKKAERQPSFFESLLGTPTSSPQEKTGPSAAPSGSRQSAPSLEQDLRLIQLAKEAARMQHKMRGLQFDESKEVDIVKEIKFVVADLELPMGVVFQENQGGCWITKIMPTGSAAKSAIRVGDQLAAIDGVSAINMTVDQVADAVRIKNTVFELTLLRYTGKLRPVKGKKKESKRASQDSSRKSDSSKPQRASTPVASTSNKKVDEKRAAGTSAGSKPTSIRQPVKKVEAPKEATEKETASTKDQKKGSSSKLFGKKSAKSPEKEEASGEKKKRFGIFGRKKKG